MRMLNLIQPSAIVIKKIQMICIISSSIAHFDSYLVIKCLVNCQKVNITYHNIFL